MMSARTSGEGLNFGFGIRMDELTRASDGSYLYSLRWTAVKNS
jgi:hypothetical protein